MGMIIDLNLLSHYNSLFSEFPIFRIPYFQNLLQIKIYDRQCLDLNRSINTRLINSTLVFLSFVDRLWSEIFIYREFARFV